MISVFEKVKTLWEKEKKLFINIFSFLTIVSIAFSCMVVESWDCIETPRQSNGNYHLDKPAYMNAYEFIHSLQ